MNFSEVEKKEYTFCMEGYILLTPEKKNIIKTLITNNFCDYDLNKILYNTLEKEGVVKARVYKSMWSGLDFDLYLNYFYRRYVIQQHFITHRHRDLLIKLMPEFSGKLQDIMKCTLKKYKLCFQI